MYLTEDGLVTSLYVKDLKTGRLSRLRTNIDGDEYIGDKMIEID